MRQVIAALLLILAGLSAQAAQYVLEVTPPSAEASPLIAYESAYAATVGGEKTAISTSEAGQIILLVTVPDGDLYLFVRPMWAGVSGSQGEWSDPVYTAATGAPYLVSATVDSAGTEVTTVWSEAVVLNGGAPTLVDAGSNTITLGSPTGADETWAWEPSRTILESDVLTLSHVQSGSGIADTEDNLWPSISGFQVINSSTQGGPLTVTGLSSSLVYVPRTARTLDLEITSSREAECRVHSSANEVLSAGEEMASADDLEHTATVSVYPGRVHVYCVQCRDAAASVESGVSCQVSFRRY
jgi:hypothetical protein